MKLISEFKNILRPLETKRREFLSTSRLKQQDALSYTHSKPCIAFLAGEPETWDKSEPVFDLLSKRDNVELFLYVCPSYDDALNVPNEYGYEWEYFYQKYPKYCKSIFREDGTLVDLNTQNLDYIFYGDPYMGHFPHLYRCYHLIRSNAKLCYIPYGFYGAKFGYDLMATNTDFFKNMYFTFADCDDVADILEGLLKDVPHHELRHIMRLGYPTLEKFLKDESFHQCNYKEVLWTPRWSYSDLGGGSHFLEYKDQILTIPENYKKFHLTLRPHPMLFAHIVQSGMMTQEDADSYKKRIKEVGADLDQHGDVNDTIRSTDIFITDYSSLIINFFMTGKPIIYCPMNDGYGSAYTKMMEGIYLAESYEDITRYLNELHNGNDPLKKTREAILESPEFKIHASASQQIVDCILMDFNSHCVK